MSIEPTANDHQKFLSSPLGWKGPQEIYSLFISTFSCSELLTFEAVAKNYDRCTQKRWKELSVEEFLNFEWLDTCTEKAHYVQGKVLCSYMMGSLPIFKQSGLTSQQLYNCLEGVMLRYKTTLGAFIWDKMRNEGLKVTSLYSNVFKFSSSRPINGEGIAGELLITGLSFQRKSMKPLEYNKIFENAISQGATCASLLLLQNCRAIDSKLEEWIFLSAKYQDYRALEILLSLFPSRTKKYYKEGCKLPPVLRRYAESLSDKSKYKKADKVWDETIAAYSNQISSQSLFEAAYTKILFNKYEEAETLIDKGIRICELKNLSIPSEIWGNASYIKSCLNKFEEAGALAHKAKEAFVLDDASMECD